MQLLRKLLLTTIMGVVGAIVLAWGFFLDTICKSPAAANSLSQNTVPSNCHGTVVFITPFQDAVLRWGWVPFFGLLFVANLVRKWQPK